MLTKYAVKERRQDVRCNSALVQHSWPTAIKLNHEMLNKRFRKISYTIIAYTMPKASHSFSLPHRQIFFHTPFILLSNSYMLSLISLHQIRTHSNRKNCKCSYIFIAIVYRYYVRCSC